jgi:hypothetical protein
MARSYLIARVVVDELRYTRAMKAPQIGDQVYLQEGSEEIGAVRQVRADHIRIYVENAGDFDVKVEAIRAVHDGKVILELAKLSESLQDAIAHAHDAEQPGL